MTRLLTADDVAAQLQYDRVTVLRKARNKEIDCVRDGRLVRFKQEHVDAYIASRETRATPRQIPARPTRYPR